MKMDKLCIIFILIGSILFLSGNAFAQASEDCIECSDCDLFENWRSMCTFNYQMCIVQGVPSSYCDGQRRQCERDIDEFIAQCMNICTDDCDESLTCPDGTCASGENCPQDAASCADNMCYEPTCTGGCGESAVVSGSTDESCNADTGCTNPPCSCDGNGNCIESEDSACHTHINPDWLETDDYDILVIEKGCTGPCGTEYLIELKEEDNPHCGERVWVWLEPLFKNIDVDKCYRAVLNTRKSESCGYILTGIGHEKNCPVCEDQIPVCSNSACESPNTDLPCQCGSAEATSDAPWCCAAGSAAVPKRQDCISSPSCAGDCMIDISFSKDSFCPDDSIIMRIEFLENGEHVDYTTISAILRKPGNEIIDLLNYLTKVGTGIYEVRGGIGTAGMRTLEVDARFGDCEAEASESYIVYPSDSAQCRDGEEPECSISTTYDKEYYCEWEDIEITTEFTNNGVLEDPTSIGAMIEKPSEIIDITGDYERTSTGVYVASNIVGTEGTRILYLSANFGNGCHAQETSSFFVYSTDECPDEEPPNPPSLCESDPDCDDENECTIDDCTSSVCVNTRKADGTACGSSRICNQGICIRVKTPDSTCDDSDITSQYPDGRNYYVKGSCTSPADDGEDYCTNTNDYVPPPEDNPGTYIFERFCNGAVCGASLYECPNGCKDGVCLCNENTVCPAGYTCDTTENKCKIGGGCSDKITMNTCLDISTCYWDQETKTCRKYDSTRQLCSDPDNGRDYSVKAHTYGFQKYPIDETQKRVRVGGKDYCLSGKLREYYCIDDHNKTFEDVTCPNGCNEGACVQETPAPSECTDTDATAQFPDGKNYYLKGDITGMYLIEDKVVTKTDYCYSSTELIEWRCNGDIIIAVIHVCPNGCEAGACRKRLTLLSPNGGESWTKGIRQYAIEWESEGVDKINIGLEGPSVRTIATEISASLGEYYWTVPTDITESDTYKIVIGSSVGTISDESDNTFTIEDPTCSSHPDCDDNNPCTEDRCMMGICSYGIKTGIPCGEGKICDNGVCVEEETPLPDLTVTYIIRTPENPNVGDLVTFTAKIKNQGAVDIEEEFYLSYSGTVGSGGNLFFPLNAGETEDWVNGIRYNSPGEYTFTVIVDSNNDVDESDETNNERTEMITISPSCTITSASITPQCNAGGTDYCEAGERIDFDVSYTGSCPSDSDLYVQIDAQSTDRTCNIEFIGGDIQGIHSGQSGLSGSWVIPYIPENCDGKTLTPIAVGLYEGGDPRTGTWKSESNNVIGTFRFAGSSACASRLEVCSSRDCCSNLECKEDISVSNYPICCEAEKCAANGVCFDSGSCTNNPNKLCARGDWVDLLPSETICNDNTDDDCDGLIDSDDPDCKSDLIVDDILWSPMDPKIGENVQFSVIVKNTGIKLVSAQSITTKLGIPVINYEKYKTITESIEPGNTLTFDFSLNPAIFSTAGRYDVIAKVDYYNSVPESNEQNNEKTEKINTHQEPCEITSASIVPSCSGGPCNEGDKISFVVTTKNVGSLLCRPESLYVQIDAISTDLSHSCDIQFSGGDIKGIYSESPGMAGSWTIPDIPEKCWDKEFRPTAVCIYEGGHPYPDDGTIIKCTQEPQKLTGRFTLSPKCTDTDNGNNDPYSVGTCTAWNYPDGVKDYCQKNMDSVTESYCHADNYCVFKTVYCPNGCEDGACTK